MITISPSTNYQPIRLCANCKNAVYVKHMKSSYSPITPAKSPTVQCSLFYKIELVFGEHLYENALDVRNDESKCGIGGKYYKGRTRSDDLVC